MSKIVNHHYVPQFYLRRFSENQRNIFVFDKITQKIIKSNIRSIASKKGFYALAQETVDEIVTHLCQRRDTVADADKLKLLETAISELKQKKTEIFESQWASLDAHFSQVYTNFIQELASKSVFNPIYKKDISFLLALQFLRTEEQRHSMRELNEKMLTWFARFALRMEGKSQEASDIKVNYSEEDLQFQHLKFMLDSKVVAGIAEILQSHIWYVGVNQTHKLYIARFNGTEAEQN